MARKTVTDDFKVFSEHLSILMKEKNVTQEELAHELGIKRQTVSLYKNGQSTPDAAQLKNIAVFFDVSTDWLLGLSNYRHIKNRLVTAKDLCMNERSISYQFDFWKRVSEMNPSGESIARHYYAIWNNFLPSQFFFEILRSIARYVEDEIRCENIKKATLPSESEIADFSNAKFETEEQRTNLIKNIQEMQDYNIWRVGKLVSEWVRSCANSIKENNT